MVNKSYRKGYNLERYCVNLGRSKGMVAFRSSGSHSPIDCCLIDRRNKKIYLIQGKASKKVSKNEKQRLLSAYSWLHDEFQVKFYIVSKPKEIREILEA
jgi:Holliday junction resolvase